MPLYEDENTTREDLEKIRLKSKCSVCGARLNMYIDPELSKAFIACWDWLRTHHEGIEREASRYEQEGLAALNIATRRKLMTEDLGPKKTSALAKYEGVLSLTKQEAKEILMAVFPEAPDQEVTRAMLLCASYQLNPLMKHVFLIPFNKGKPNESWATVIGIKAKRLLASRPDRKGQPRPYSYIDNTPRVMTEDEQKATFGEVDPNKLWVVTKLRDPLTGAEAVGYGYWPKDTVPYGAFGSPSGDKGNTQFNMAAIRSESPALDRLRPGEMPVGIEVMPEEYIEADYKVVEEKPPDTPPLEATTAKQAPKEHWCEEHNCAFELKTSRYGSFYAHKKPKGGWCNEAKPKDATPKAQPHIPGSAENLPLDEPGAEESQKPQRDPDTLKTINDLYKACNEDFKDKEGKGMQPAQVISELGVISQSDISDTPADCYRKIVAVR